MDQGQRRAREEQAIVLDFLQHGYPFDKRPSHKKTPIAQAVGCDHFTLLELVPKQGVFLQPNEMVYIGVEKREKIHHIQGKLAFDKLTVTAQAELEHIAMDLVKKNEQRYVEWFNKAQPVTIRIHQLELLPGLGKKHVKAILDARKEKEFESFADMKARVKLMPDPVALIFRRILSELQGNEKHNVFVDR